MYEYRGLYSPEISIENLLGISAVIDTGDLGGPNQLKCIYIGCEIEHSTIQFGYYNKFGKYQFFFDVVPDIKPITIFSTEHPPLILGNNKLSIQYIEGFWWGVYVNNQLLVKYSLYGKTCKNPTFCIEERVLNIPKYKTENTDPNIGTLTNQGWTFLKEKPIFVGGWKQSIQMAEVNV